MVSQIEDDGIDEILVYQDKQAHAYTFKFNNSVIISRLILTRISYDTLRLILNVTVIIRRNEDITTKAVVYFNQILN